MSDFDDLFRAATGGLEPYGYQRELAEMREPPSILDIPTGAGKTDAIILSWLYGRLTRSDVVPRRLVYALPMRTLVEQTARVADGIRERLGLSEDELGIYLLMGGEPAPRWREQPEQSMILIGTIDMLISRALNRGYGESRFQWPVAFGLLNSDCRWVFDEVQLMGPACVTSAQLAGLRTALKTYGPTETIWASATVDPDRLRTVDHPTLGTTLTLSEADRDGPLGRLLSAEKIVSRVDLSAIREADLPSTYAPEILDRHRAGKRTIVVLNTVERAIKTYQALRKLAPDGLPVTLLHSRFRPGDRERHLAEALSNEIPAAGRVIVATQVIEAGVDVSSELLISEPAPFSSIVQRLGRCNRRAEEPSARFVWLDIGDPLDRARQKLAAPYRPDDVAHAREALVSLAGTSASPNRLSLMPVPEAVPETAVLRRSDLLDLFDTGPDLSGIDIDIAPYIRDDDDRNVTVFFRATDLPDQPPPGRAELVQGPLADVREVIEKRHAVVKLKDHVTGEWVRLTPRDVRPGHTVMLDCAAGGYDPDLGWAGKLVKAPVTPLTPAQAARDDAIGDNVESEGQREWMSLSDHLARAHDAAGRLAASLLPSERHAALTQAAALHDIGKAFLPWQQALLATAPEAERDAIGRAAQAKSPYRGWLRNPPRPRLRHELASALALIAARDVAPALVDWELVVYLVAAHHGRVRMSIRPAPDESRLNDPDKPQLDGRPQVLGLLDGDEMPACDTPLGTIPATTLSLSAMEIGGGERGLSWTNLASTLRDDEELGPFRLGYLEALVRIADWRAS